MPGKITLLNPMVRERLVIDFKRAALMTMSNSFVNNDNKITLRRSGIRLIAVT